MLGDGQELHVREPEPLHVLHELLGQLAVAALHLRVVGPSANHQFIQCQARGQGQHFVGGLFGSADQRVGFHRIHGLQICWAQVGNGQLRRQQRCDPATVAFEAPASAALKLPPSVFFSVCRQSRNANRGLGLV